MNHHIFANGLFGIGGMVLLLMALSFPNRQSIIQKDATGKCLENIPGRVPVELVSFQADVKSNEVILSWDARDELELVGYQVERSMGTEEFQRVGWVYCREITREPYYEFVDDNVKLNQVCFYRLKMVDFEGQIEYSPVIIAAPSRF